jgi:hypothetical protein
MRNYYLLLFVVLFSNCKKDETINPYDDPNLDPPTEDSLNYFTDPTSFSALHNNIFSPTCANSGCHDGTFEPDFRTIESAYNTLIYHPIIKNDAANTYQYRVIPGDADMSILYQRLIIDIDGISGIMPLSAENSWNDNKEQYIQNIKDWINGGAKDIFGNSPIQANLLPQMKGMLAFITGQSTILPRDGFRGSIFVPSTANSLDVWFSVTDDQLVANQLTYNKIKYSNSLFNFEQKPEYSLEVKPSPILENGYYGSQMVEYYHKYVLDVSNYNQGDIVFIKIYVQDNVNSVTEIPTNGSEYQIVKYFTLEFI